MSKAFQNTKNENLESTELEKKEIRCCGTKKQLDVV